MNFLKLKTAEGTHRELDLIDYAIYSRDSDRSFDSTIENADGTQAIYQRARRRSFTIALDGVPQSDVDTLELIFKDRQECYLEGNVGENTVIYHPMESAKEPMIGGTPTFTRASIATYRGLDGLIREVAAGIPRFEPCKLGNGILLEMARTNYFYPSHGASGSTIWTTQAGSPVVAWDTSIASNVYGKAGTVRIEMTTTTPDVVKATISGLTASTAYSCYIWAKGIGSVTLTVTSATGTTSSGTVTLSMEWQRISVEGFVTTGTSVEMRLTAISADTRLWISAHQVEAGYVVTSYVPTTVAAATRLMDQYSIPAALNFAEGSIAFWIRFPRITAGADGTRYAWYMSGNFYVSINPNGNIYFGVASGVGISVSQATHGLVADDIAHLAFVWQRGYAAVIVNGVVVGSSASTVRDSGGPTTLQLYYSTGSAMALIDDLRVDARYVEWRTSEGGFYMRYSSTSNLAFAKLTQGRLFRIARANFKPREADPAYLDGTLAVEESSSDGTFTLGAA